MEFFLSVFTSHQIAVIAVLSVGLLVVYLLVKSLFRLALFFTVILICVGLYFYMTAPKRSPADVMRAWEGTKKQVSEFVDVGKKAIDKGKELMDKGQKIAEKLEKITK